MDDHPIESDAAYIRRMKAAGVELTPREAEALAYEDRQAEAQMSTARGHLAAS
jgi:hypothetical protein